MTTTFIQKKICRNFFYILLLTTQPSLLFSQSCPGGGTRVEDARDGSFENGGQGSTYGPHQPWSNPGDCQNAGVICSQPGQRMITGNVANFNQFLSNANPVDGNRMLLIDGVENPNAIAWQQNVNIDPNKPYEFSAFVQALRVLNDPNPPQISRMRFEVVGNVTGTTVLNSFRPQTNWQRYTANWDSGPNTSVTIRLIIEGGPSNLGNDYAIDDISFSYCEPTCNMTVSVSRNHTTCGNNNGSISVTASNGTPGYSYSWDHGPNGRNLSNLAPGTYRVTVRDAAGCEERRTVTINNSSGPNANAGNDQEICQGESTTISASGGGSYSWNQGLGNGRTKTVSPNSTTTYTVTVTVNGCTDTDNVRVTVNPRPNADAGPNVTICEGESTTLRANGGGSYSWNRGLGTGRTKTVSPTTTTTYTVTVTNSDGCEDTDDVTVTVNPEPNADAGPNVEICEGESTTLQASGGGSYSWNQGLGNGRTKTVSPTSTTTYTVTVTSGGCTDTDNVTVTVNPAPNADAGPNVTICDGESTTLQASGGGSYSWNRGLGTGRTKNVSPSTTTTYTVTVTNSDGCEDTDDVTVTVTPQPVADAGPNVEICIGESTTLQASGGTNYSWNQGLGNGRTKTVSPTTTTTYTVTASTGNCDDTDDVTVTVHPLPVADAGDDQTICEGDDATLQANGGGSYSWNRGLGTGRTKNVSPNSTTTYTVTVTDGNGCEDTDDVTVNVTPIFLPDAGPDQELCDQTTTTLNANTPTGSASGSWSVASGGSDVSFPTDPGSDVTGLSTGVNELVWTIINGVCPDERDTVVINNFPPLTLPDAGPDQTVCTASYQLNGNAVATGETGTWTVQAGSGTFVDPNDPNTIVNGLAVGPNTFRWTISNGVCPDRSAEVTITNTGNLTTPNAGPDQTLCDETSFDLNANAVGSGETGSWTVTQGGAGLTSDSNPSTTASPLVIGINQFVWTISNGTCPDAHDTITIHNFPPLTAPDAGDDETICTASYDLNANAVALGESGQWSVQGGTGTFVDPNDPSTTVNGLSVGPNTFRWTISNGGICPDRFDDVIINNTGNLTAPDAGDDQQLCNETTTTLAGNPVATGETGSWSTASGGASVDAPANPASTVSNLAPGINEFVWTISNGGICPDAHDTVIVNNHPPLTLPDAGEDSTICTTSYTLSANAVQPWETGSWSVLNGSGNFADANDPNTTVTGLTIGDNIFQWTISNGGICPDIDDQVTITNTGDLTLPNAGDDQQLCNETSASLTGNTPAAGESGTWNMTLGGATLSATNTPSVTANGLTIGINEFVWTISNGVCPDLHDTVIVDNYPALTIPDAGEDTTICTNAWTLAANSVAPGETGTWSLTNGSATIVDPNNPGTNVTDIQVGTNTFVWTISNGGICPDTSDDMNIINTGNLTSPDAGPDDEICNQLSYGLNANSVQTGETGTWSVVQAGVFIAGENNPGAAANGLTPGIYDFVWTISNGVCPDAHDTVVINNFPPITPPEAGPDDTLCTFETTLAANTLLLPIETGTWRLISGTGNFADINDPTTFVDGLTITDNVFEWTISNGVCPDEQDTVVITSIGDVTPAGAGRDSTICDDTYTLDGNLAADGENGTWTTTGGANITPANAANATVSNLDPGPNTFTWTLRNAACSSSAQVTIQRDLDPTPANAGNPETICSINGQLSANDPDIGTGFWTTSSTAQIASPASHLTVVTGLVEGTIHTFRWTTSNGVCPDTYDEVTIERVFDLEQPDAGPDSTICGTQITLTATDPVTSQGETGRWSLLDGGATIVSNTTPTTAVTNMDEGDNIFRWTIFNGVCADIHDDVIVHNIHFVLPEVSIDVDLNPICAHEPIANFEVTETKHPGDNPTFEWFINGVSTGETSTDYFAPLIAHDDYVSVIMTSSVPCPSVNPVGDSIQMLVESCECPLFIPNAISPNEDLANDTWKIDGMDCWDENSIRIYNRYGSLVYKANDPVYIPWDATRNGEPMPVAVYYYVIDVKNNPNPLIPGSKLQKKTYTGIITVMR